jgi:hypothetical protein
MPNSCFSEFDQPPRPSLHLTTAYARPPLFLPPSSPSATSSLSRSQSSSHPLTHRATSKNDSLKRKRMRRNDYASDSTPTPRQNSQCESPAAFVNTRYRIAGGLDTPLAVELDAEERHEEDLRELDYRQNRMTLVARQNSGSYFPRTPAIGRNDRRVGRKRAHSDDQSGWGRTVVNLVGGVAGKVLNFWWNGAFRGFQAGGGQAYRMTSDTPAIIEQSTWMDVDEKDDVFNKHYEAQRYHNLTPVPGQFPEEGFIDDYMSQPQAYRAVQPTTPVPHADIGGSSLRSNWVLVDNSDGSDKRHRTSVLPTYKDPQTTGHRPKSRPSLTAAGHRSRLAPTRPSLAGSPGFNAKRPASFASPRASPGRSSANETDFRTASSPGHRRSRSSMASPRRTAEVQCRPAVITPSSPDIQRFEKKIRRKERQEDESIQRLNKQLQDMIKEGKEALGTRIEIEDDPDEDEGYGEGTEMMGASKW